MSEKIMKNKITIRRICAFVLAVSMLIGCPSLINQAASTYNIAPNATIEAECPDWAVQGGIGPEKMIDQNMSNSFSTSTYVNDAETEKYIYLTFDKAYTVNEIALYPRTTNNKYAGGFPKDFTVSLWNGTEWIQVASKSGYNATTRALTIKFSAMDCRAMRIHATKLDHVDGGSQYALQLAEIVVYGGETDAVIDVPKLEQPNTKTNIASYSTVTAECPNWAVQGGIGPEKMVDANYTNFSTSTYVYEANTTKEIYLTFDKTYLIQEIVLYPRTESGKYAGGFPKDFTVSLWNGTEWVEVAKKTNVSATTEKMKIDFPEMEARAMRIQATKLGLSDIDGQYALQLAEIDVFGIQTENTIQAPQITLPGAPEGGDTPEGGGTPGGDMYDGESNAALGGTVNAECPDWAIRGTLGPDKLVDQNRTTSFYTSSYVGSPKTTKEIYITFEETHSIHEVRLYPRLADGKYAGGFPENFTVSVWTGKGWKQVGEKTGYKSSTSPVIFEFNNIICNAVRIQATRLGKSDDGIQYALQFSEIEALGTVNETKLSAPVIADETSFTITIDSNKNIAQKCPAKASSDWTQYSAGVGNINDGNIYSFFATNGDIYQDGDTVWAEINLLDNYFIDTVILASRQKAWGFPYDFTISVYYDGKWTDVVKEVNFEADESDIVALYKFNFKPTLGNKIRISSNNFRLADKDKAMVINEMAVYGEKAIGDYVLANENVISTGIAISATSTMNDYGYYLNHLTDSDLSTEWSSVPATSADEQQIIELDFERELQLGEVMLKPSWGGYGFPVDFEIQLYRGEQWVTVYNATDYEQPADEAIQKFSFTPQRTTKLRLVVTKMAKEGGLYVVKLNEIMAFPYATGDDFDLDKIDEIRSEKVYADTELIGSGNKASNNAGNKGAGVTLHIARIVLGAVFSLGAIAGCIFMLRKINKEKK